MDEFREWYNTNSEYKHSNDPKESDDLSHDEKPWGWSVLLAQGKRFRVKQITIVPNSGTALVAHLHRNVHWTVVSGTAFAQVGNQEIIVSENECAYIPLGLRHQIKNPGKIDLCVIEVQTGVYLVDDDVTQDMVT